MDINGRELSKDDFYQLFQELKPAPINYFNVFLAITCALLVSSAIQAGVAHLYFQHQVMAAQEQARTSVQQFEQALKDRAPSRARE